MAMKAPEHPSKAQLKVYAKTIETLTGMSYQGAVLAISGKDADRTLTARNTSIVARHYGVDTDWLATGDGDMARPVVVAGLDEYDIRVAKLFHRLPKGDTKHQVYVNLTNAVQLEDILARQAVEKRDQQAQAEPADAPQADRSSRSAARKAVQDTERKS